MSNNTSDKTRRRKEKPAISVGSAQTLQPAIEKVENTTQKREWLQDEKTIAHDYLHTVLESLTHPFYLIDADDFTIKIANSSARTMGVHELSTCYRLTHHRDTPCASDEHPCPLQITKRTKQPVVVEHVHYDQEGNSRILEVHGFPILDRAGRVTEMIEYSLDVTSRKNAEQELRNTKDDLNNLMESSLDAIIVTDRMGYITRVNKYFLELFGYSKEEVLGKQVLQLTPFEDFGTFASTTGEAVEIGSEFIDVANQMITELIEKGKVTNWEAYYFRKDKKVVPVEQNIVNLFNTEGKKTGAVAIIRDITERKKAADALKRSEAYLDNIIESSLDAIISTDSKGYVTRVNRSFLELLGYTKAEALGRHMAEFSPLETGTYLSTTGEGVSIDQAFMDRVAQTMTSLRRDGRLSNLEFYLMRKDGTVIPVEENIVYFYDKNGTLSGAVGVVRDVTERKKAEREIREGKEFLEKIIAGSKDGIIICDERGDILSVNKAVEEMLSLDKEQIVGRHSSELHADDTSERGKVRERITELLEKGFTSYETRYKRKDGKFVEVECYSSMISNNGTFIGGMSIVRDITERNRMQQQMLQSEKLRSLGELSGGVAHDFNNVLAAILGRVQLLKLQFKPPDGKQEQRKSILDLMRSLDIIEKASIDGAETVRRIQEFSRKRSDDRDFAQVDINELIDNALEFTRVRWKNNAESRGIKFSIHREYASLPPTSASASEIREVLTNIINNALDAMPQGGGLTLRTFAEDSYLCIQIADTGAGMSEAIRQRIFDPFFTTKGVHSTGLGMSISYGIINRHQGTIAVESSEGKGTTFTIKLPAIKDRLSHHEQLKDIPVKQRKAKVLVIEDEETVRQLLSDILASGDHDVEVAAGGLQGIEAFNSKSFDLVFTDLGMPDMSGWEVAESIKNTNRQTPVVLVTGWNVDITSEGEKGNLVDAVIQKPFEVDQVLGSVQKLVVR